MVGYFTYNIIATNAQTEESLLEAEQLLGDMKAYGGGALDAQPQDATLDPGGTGIDGTPAAPAGSGDPGATANQDSQGNTGKQGNSGQQGGSGKQGSPAPAPTPKPKPQVIGLMVFESLGGRKVALLDGSNDEALSRGAAHHPRTVAPGASGNCVIFGHRNTVFRGFDKLKVGHTIRVEVPGEEAGSKIVYKYKIVSMAVVEPNDPKVFQSYGGKVMTLVTCYPFHYVGPAPQRYMVVAELQ